MTTPKNMVIAGTIVEVSEAHKPPTHPGNILVWKSRDYCTSPYQLAIQISTGIRLEILSSPIKALRHPPGMDVQVRVLNGELAGQNFWVYLGMIRYGTTPV